MAEREFDRAHPERLREQAVAALVTDADREFSPEFRRKLIQQQDAPTLFGTSELTKAARSGLEIEVVRSLQSGSALTPVDAVSEAVRRRGDGYSRELKSQLVADRHSQATVISTTVKDACETAAPIAAVEIMNGRPMPRASNRVRLDENLLSVGSSGAAR